MAARGVHLETKAPVEPGVEAVRAPMRLILHLMWMHRAPMLSAQRERLEQPLRLMTPTAVTVAWVVIARLLSLRP